MDLSLITKGITGMRDQARASRDQVFAAKCQTALTALESRNIVANPELSRMFQEYLRLRELAKQALSERRTNPANMHLAAASLALTTIVDVLTIRTAAQAPSTLTRISQKFGVAHA